MPSRRTPSTADERRALRGTEDHVVAADDEIALWVAGLHPELARRERGLRAQEAGIEAHGGVLDRLAGLAEELERLRVVELDADLGREPVDAARRSSRAPPRTAARTVACGSRTLQRNIQLGLKDG